MTSSQNEQDSRFWGKYGNFLVLEPSDPAQVRDFVKLGLELSERYGMPAMLRLSTRLCNSRGPVELHPRVEHEPAGFQPDQSRSACSPRANRQQYFMQERIQELRKDPVALEVNHYTPREGADTLLITRIGNRYFAPMIPKGQVDILVGLEELEGLRWSSYLKPGGTAIINKNQVYPPPVLLEKDEYPRDVEDQLRRQGYRVVAVGGPGSARRLGNIRLANTVVLGALARELEIPQEHWLRAIAAWFLLRP